MNEREVKLRARGEWVVAGSVEREEERRAAEAAERKAAEEVARRLRAAAEYGWNGGL